MAIGMCSAQSTEAVPSQECAVQANRLRSIPQEDTASSTGDGSDLQTVLLTVTIPSNAESPGHREATAAAGHFQHGLLGQPESPDEDQPCQA